jgi:hypothetical protein
MIDAHPGQRIEIEPGLWLDVVAHAPWRGAQSIGVRLAYGATTFDLIGDARALEYAPGADVIFIGPLQADAQALARARPRWVVWADASIPPPRVDAPRLRSIALRDVESASFSSDGAGLIVK